MEEKCSDAINNIVVNLSIPNPSSTTAAKTEFADTVIKTFLSNDNLNDTQLQCSMSLAEAPTTASDSVNDESQHQLELEEVFHDETTNSGVLETFDQNSTASVTVSEVNSALESIKSNIFRDDSGDDCSSTESGIISTVTEEKASKEDNCNESFKTHCSSTQHSKSNGRSQEKTTKINTSQVSSNELLENQTNSVIISTNVTTIYLETPIVDDQQHHINHHSQIICNSSNEYLENATKPKRLSDEFMLVENDIEVAETNTINNVCKDEELQDDDEDEEELEETTLNVINGENIYCIDTCKFITMKGKGDQKIEGILVSDLQHDKMSFRLKKMNINNSPNENNNAAFIEDDIPSSSYTTYAQSMADIQSMDLIERRDFENEQRLTGGILLKSSSLINKNKLNLNLIHSCTKKQPQTQQQQEHVGQQSTQHNNDESCSSSSNINIINNGGRAVSSDSKCAYKDTSTTPTSSRAYNSRLTKSTAKIDLCPTLSHQQQQQQQIPQMKQKTNGVSVSKLQLIKSSTVIVEAPSTSSSASLAHTTAVVKLAAAGGGAELYSNSNSNDSLASERCFSNTSKISNAATNTDQILNCHQAEQQQVTEEVTAGDTGCSRTNAIKAVNNLNDELYDDSQPSTSARCQYAPVLKNLRQVNASAQTSEKYISRAVTCSNTSSGVGNSSGNLSTYRQRRKDHLITNGISEDVIAAFKVKVAEAAAAAASTSSSSSTKERTTEYHEDPWADCEENSDIEEICTCHHSASGSSHGGSNTSLNETEDYEMITGVKDADLSNYIQMVSISEDKISHSVVSSPDCTASLLSSNQQQRKRKYNEGRLIENDHNATVFNSGGDANGRKRIAYDYASTPRSSLILSSVGCTTPSSSMALTSGSPISRRTPRSIIPTRDNPPPELQDWLAQFQRWTHAERLLAVDRLIEHCEPTQVRHMMKVIEPQFQRDFISLLPRELALQVLAYLDPMDLLRAAQTCRSWRFLCDDNLLWKEKCRKAQILTEPRSDRPKRGRAGNMPHISSPWKAAYMRQHIIEMNWRSRPIREPKVLKGHDDHVITCLQFSGNRIVSGSDDNTLKVWSAVTGRCLRTLVGHTGGVWSSQMSGNIIISGSTDRTLKVWDMETGQCVHTLLGHTSTVRCMHLHGKRVVSGSRDATLRVWDIELGTCLHVLVGHLAAVRCVQYDGKLIVSGAYDYMVKIWHPERQECLHTLQGHTNRVYSLQFDGIHVVSGSLDTSIRVWDVETGNCKHTLMGHQSLTSGMELRQNILVSGNADSTVKVWDITTGQCLQTLSGPNKHQSAVTCLQFNSRFVVTSSDDGTVKLWDVKTGEFIRNLVALDSGGSGGVVWRIRANDTKLICAVGSRNGTEETKLMVLDFDVEGACVKCS